MAASFFGFATAVPRALPVGPPGEARGPFLASSQSLFMSGRHPLEHSSFSVSQFMRDDAESSRPSSLRESGSEKRASLSQRSPATRTSRLSAATLEALASSETDRPGVALSMDESLTVDSLDSAERRRSSGGGGREMTGGAGNEGGGPSLVSHSPLRIYSPGSSPERRSDSQGRFSAVEMEAGAEEANRARPGGSTGLENSESPGRSRRGISPVGTHLTVPPFDVRATYSSSLCSADSTGVEGVPLGAEQAVSAGFGPSELIGASASLPGSRAIGQAGRVGEVGLADLAGQADLGGSGSSAGSSHSSQISHYSSKALQSLEALSSTTFSATAAAYDLALCAAVLGEWRDAYRARQYRAGRSARIFLRWRQLADEKRQFREREAGRAEAADAFRRRCLLKRGLAGLSVACDRRIHSVTLVYSSWFSWRSKHLIKQAEASLVVLSSSRLLRSAFSAFQEAFERRKAEAAASAGLERHILLHLAMGGLRAAYASSVQRWAEIEAEAARRSDAAVLRKRFVSWRRKVLGHKEADEVYASFCKRTCLSAWRNLASALSQFRSARAESCKAAGFYTWQFRYLCEERQRRLSALAEGFLRRRSAWMLLTFMRGVCTLRKVFTAWRKITRARALVRRYSGTFTIYCQSERGRERDRDLEGRFNGYLGSHGRVEAVARLWLVSLATTALPLLALKGQVSAIRRRELLVSAFKGLFQAYVRRNRVRLEDEALSLAGKCVCGGQTPGGRRLSLLDAAEALLREHEFQCPVAASPLSRGARALLIRERRLQRAVPQARATGPAPGAAAESVGPSAALGVSRPSASATVYTQYTAERAVQAPPVYPRVADLRRRSPCRGRPKEGASSQVSPQLQHRQEAGNTPHRNPRRAPRSSPGTSAVPATPQAHTASPTNMPVSEPAPVMIPVSPPRMRPAPEMDSPSSSPEAARGSRVEDPGSPRIDSPSFHRIMSSAECFRIVREQRARLADLHVRTGEARDTPHLFAARPSFSGAPPTTDSYSLKPSVDAAQPCSFPAAGQTPAADGGDTGFLVTSTACDTVAGRGETLGAPLAPDALLGQEGAGEGAPLSAECPRPPSAATAGQILL